MKVMCINNDWPNKNIPNLEVGNIYTVDGIPTDFQNSYYLAEITGGNNGGRYSYGQIRFATISDIDEMELVNERELVNY